MNGPGKVLTLTEILDVDGLAHAISNMWQTWDSLRQEKKTQWSEVRKYRYATDTTTTSNNQLPWKNKTTYPKLTQISDNLWANYFKSLFPKRKWLIWEGLDKKSDDADKRDAIENYMMSVVEQSGFKKTVSDLLDDWIQSGNCFATVEWADERVLVGDRQQVGYVGPKAVRINPLDIVFNPIAADFGTSPKIIRKFVTLGDLKEEISRLSPSDDEALELWEYLKELRNPSSRAWGSDVGPEDEYLRVDGFTDWRTYLGSDYCEVLTFHGDLFDRESGEFYKNHIITVVDRHKVIGNKPNESFFGKPVIYNSVWRSRPDNLWGMGPLDNLVGMQYRIDHLENLKADVMDLNAFPPMKVKGFVRDFKWGPGEKIYTDEEGDVDMMAPHWEILNTNLEIDGLERKMEEIAGAPKEALGMRTPGEKTKYEVQRLENASGRIYQARLEQFEEFEEQVLQAMLEMSRRRLTSTELRVWDDEFKIATFQTLTPQDITGNGRLRPVAAKHFAEQAERVQNLSAFFNSQVGQDQSVNVHISGLATAKLFEELLEVQQYKLVNPFIRISEMYQAQNLGNKAQEQSAMQIQSPSGLTPDDVSGESPQPAPQGSGGLPIPGMTPNG